VGLRHLFPRAGANLHRLHLLPNLVQKLLLPLLLPPLPVSIASGVLDIQYVVEGSQTRELADLQIHGLVGVPGTNIVAQPVVSHIFGNPHAVQTLGSGQQLGALDSVLPLKNSRSASPSPYWVARARAQ